MILPIISGASVNPSNARIKVLAGGEVLIFNTKIIMSKAQYTFAPQNYEHKKRSIYVIST